MAATERGSERAQTDRTVLATGDHALRQDAAALSLRVDTLTPAERSIHNNFVESVRSLRRDLVRSIAYLRAVQEHRIHHALGFARIGDYASAVAGLTARQTREFLTLGRRLPTLPALSRALDEGTITWARAREICSRATPENEQQLIDLARSVSREQLRRQRFAGPGAAATPLAGSSVSAPPQPSLARAAPASPGFPIVAPAHGEELQTPRRSVPRVAPPTTVRPAPPAAPDLCHLQLKLTPEQLARWESLVTRLQIWTGGRPQTDLLLDALDQAAASARDGAPMPTEGSPPPYLIVLLQCENCGEARIVTGHGESRASRAMLAAAHCDATIEGPDGARHRTIAPRLRRLAMQRARFRCEAAGCRHTRFLEVHHRRPAAGGGDDSLANLVVLCARCHRRLHEAEARMRDDRLAAETIAATTG